MTINERINEIRFALGLTQAKIAERITISTSYYADIERSDKKVNDRIIRLICSEFGVSEHWLRSGDGEMFSDNANATRAANLFNSLMPSFQEFALIHLEALVDLQNRQ
jgi:transcriptional regulator with XRE-family HTH domain